jgi:hypothetical protein
LCLALGLPGAYLQGRTRRTPGVDEAQP